MKVQNEWKHILSEKNWGEIASEISKLLEPLDDILFITTEENIEEYATTDTEENKGEKS